MFKTKTYQPAFTIIEVVLVLAIAGLIFLMVFVALPALQRNQRDAQRKQYMSKLADAFVRCASNNHGRCRLDSLVATSYLKADEWKDPVTGETYVTNAQTGDSAVYRADRSAWEIGHVYWNLGGRCVGGDPRDISESGFRIDDGFANFVAVTKLEGGGIVCISNLME